MNPQSEAAPDAGESAVRGAGRRGARRSASEFLSVAAAANRIGVSEVTLYRAISAGEFPAVRIRGRLIVPARAIEAMAETAVAEQTEVDASFWVSQPRAARRV